MSYFPGQNETNEGRDIKAPVLTNMKNQRLILKMSRGGQFDALPMVFPKLYFLEKGLSPEFFSFNVIIRHILPEHFIEIPHIVRNI